MTMPEWAFEAVKGLYEQWGARDYSRFLGLAQELVTTAGLNEDEWKELQNIFDDPHPVFPTDAPEEDDVEVFLREPPDVGPLAGLRSMGWITPGLADELRRPTKKLQALLGITDEEVLADIQENALHILGRCNNPHDWGETNHSGLVYGMVQSGKTASMIAVIDAARRVGYRLIIILAGDKSSLRNQTQGRINRAFDLEGGVNKAEEIHSPTWDGDFAGLPGGYTQHFRTAGRFGRGEEFMTVIVIKKNSHHLRALISELGFLSEFVEQRKRTFAKEYPALILDDESDYGSQNTNPFGSGPTIHNEIVRLRNSLPWNTYVGYTATPQACISADPKDIVGYPKDFIWLLEPFMEKVQNEWVPRTYFGAWDAFWRYDGWVIREIERNGWPHYERDHHGRPRGIYVPPLSGTGAGTFADSGAQQIDTQFLGEIIAGGRPAPSFIDDAIIDFFIVTGIRWWRHWQKEQADEPPTIKRIKDKYPHVACMIHLSRTQENQGLVRELVQSRLPAAIQAYAHFKEDSQTRTRFADCWKRQRERTEDLRHKPLPSIDQLIPFIDACIEITQEPIRNHAATGYPIFPGNPFVYMINSSDDGMELFYGQEHPPQIQTKKAAIIVGGDILSRGLTVEGLLVSVFGRASQMPLGDATLQMGRWFGHKRFHLDLITIYMQNQVREVFSQVAHADRYLRLQVKQSIYHGHKPDRVLLELRNSPLFRVTSPSKSTFLAQGRGQAYSGQRVELKEPSLDLHDILHNNDVLDRFAQRKAGGRKVHNRAMLFENVPFNEVIRLLNEFKTGPDAGPVSFKDYAEYIEDWRTDRNLPDVPPINLVILDGLARRKRLLSASHPKTAEEARAAATPRFGAIVGGQSGDGRYRGDAFLDRPASWHAQTQTLPKKRHPGDPILIAFYRLHPNYLTKRLFNPEANSWRTEEVMLQPRDPLYVGEDGFSIHELALVTFAVWTPDGGPLYQVGTNRLIDTTKAKQRGIRQINGGSDEED
jgi:hypothetical protein